MNYKLVTHFHNEDHEKALLAQMEEIRFRQTLSKIEEFQLSPQEYEELLQTILKGCEQE